MAGTETTSVDTGRSEVASDHTVLPSSSVDPDAGTGLRIGLIAAAGSDAFSRAVTDSVAAQATLSGAELIRCDPGDDPALVLDCARRLATQDVDGWIVHRAAGIAVSLCELGPVGVPLVTIDADPVPCRTVAVGSDDTRAGHLVGATLGRAARQRDSCPDARLVVVGAAAPATEDAAADPADAGTTERRVAGIRAGFADECPGRSDAEVFVDPGDPSALGAILGELPPDADVLIAAIDDVRAQQVAAAIALLPPGGGDVAAVAAVGAGEFERCQLRTDRRWVGAAALFPDRYGQLVLPTLLAAMAGEAVPEFLHVQTVLLTASTVEEYYDTTGCTGR
ncbi:LacI family DNA-binding transcriptional regulator [Nakamurella flavida]|uniref:LacI family DNA-binding transcriptional regulator n=1 Tax=Nakamurella flavida TaxID=363630 RepID=A0A938YL87_9ACTN|nr:LacI family DNA-binding transcriptional regulator [Nakamurella flavida]MBM9475324.1 LacI family DNA-binding transcriptional regulator [Nakamurella flavida]MDP9776898.1 ribose transport system substrate-binding protein [Nakamurella flavida]